MAQYLTVPIRFQFLKAPTIWTIRTVSGRDQREFAFSICLPAAPRGNASTLSELDGWSCRDDFFKVSEGNNAGMLRFLEKVGVWSNAEILNHWSEEVAQHHKSGNPVPVDMLGLWHFRSALRDALVNRTRFKETYAPELPPLKTDIQLLLQRAFELPLHFELTKVASGVVRTTEAYQMLLATVFVDVARGIRFKTCKRKDCGAPFAVESNHDRKFCCQYCGHLVSQRKRRAQEKKLRSRRLVK